MPARQAPRKPSSTRSPVADTERAEPSPARHIPTTLGEAFSAFARHRSPRLLFVCTVLAALRRSQLGPLSAADFVAAAALLAFWPLQEWLIHVFILHFRPRKVGRWTLDFAVPKAHRAHHRDPWDYELLFIPFHSYAYSLPLLLLSWHLAAPTSGVAWSGITLHLALALQYEWVHFLVHTRVPPRFGPYRIVWRNHRLHHFRNENYWYGVTRLEADWLLGTAPEPAAVPVSPTARTLGG
ncbi:MAG: fatty acid hydroxylase [Candidatus Binatia bacterium]|nr:MAG: fatty acid hydroxylase [Candidatus Binatia bacterium]